MSHLPKLNLKSPYYRPQKDHVLFVSPVTLCLLTGHCPNEAPGTVCPRAAWACLQRSASCFLEWGMVGVNLIYIHC